MKTLPTKDWTWEAGAPAVVHVTYEGKKYVLRLNMAVLGVLVADGLGNNPELPNFGVQSGNVMSIELET
jgi:hypothetical protein